MIRCYSCWWSRKLLYCASPITLPLTILSFRTHTVPFSPDQQLLKVGLCGWAAVRQVEFSILIGRVRMVLIEVGALFERTITNDDQQWRRQPTTTGYSARVEETQVDLDKVNRCVLWLCGVLWTVDACKSLYKVVYEWMDSSSSREDQVAEPQQEDTRRHHRHAVAGGRWPQLVISVTGFQVHPR